MTPHFAPHQTAYVSALCGGGARFAIRVIWQFDITVSEQVLEIDFMHALTLYQQIYVRNHRNDAGLGISRVSFGMSLGSF